MTKWRAKNPTTTHTRRAFFPSSNLPRTFAGLRAHLHFVRELRQSFEFGRLPRIAKSGAQTSKFVLGLLACWNYFCSARGRPWVQYAHFLR